LGKNLVDEAHCLKKGILLLLLLKAETKIFLGLGFHLPEQAKPLSFI